MHELSLAQIIVEQLLEVAHTNNAKKLVKGVLSFSDFSMISPEQFHSALEVISEDQSLFHGIIWEIIRSPGEIECYKCGYRGFIPLINRNRPTFKEYEFIEQLTCPKCKEREVHPLFSDSIIIDSLEIEKEEK